MNKRGFTLSIYYRDYSWHSPYTDTFKRRIEVYDPFQTREHLPLDKVDSAIAPYESLEYQSV